jgi:hypothetical protein
MLMRRTINAAATTFDGAVALRAMSKAMRLQKMRSVPNMLLQLGLGIVVLAIGLRMLVHGYSDARALAADYSRYVRLQNLLMSYWVWTIGYTSFALLLGLAQILSLFTSIEVRRWMAGALPILSLTVLICALVSFFLFNRYKRSAIRLENLRPNDI